MPDMNKQNPNFKLLAFRRILWTLTAILGLCLIPATAKNPNTNFQFQKLKPQKVDTNHCSYLLKKQTAGPIKKLQDEENIIITNWNPRDVMALKGPHKYMGIDAETKTYKYVPDVAVPVEHMQEWQFDAKQDKIADASFYLGFEDKPLSHIIISPEVDSIEAANTLFNSNDLKGKYRTFLVEGNDSRGIDIAFAIRADLDVTVEVETYKETTWRDPVEGQRAKLFSRDLPVLIIRDRETKKVLLVVVGNHAKSQRDRAGDIESKIIRTAQYQAAGKIIQSYFDRFGKNLPLVFAGDFNTNIQTSDQLAPIKAILGEDSLAVAGVEDRTTSTYHPLDGGPMEASQIDAAFFSPCLSKGIVKAVVLPEFHPVTGNLLPQAPLTYEDRENFYPSDHRAISTMLSGQVLRECIE
jgi:hypothetical protein